MDDGLTVLVKIVQAVSYVTKDRYAFAGAKIISTVGISKVGM